MDPSNQVKFLASQVAGLSISQPNAASPQPLFDKANEDDEIDYLESVLKGEEEKKFHEFPVRDMQSCLRLLISRFVRTRETKPLSLLLHALPYYACYLYSSEEDTFEGITSRVLMQALNGQDADIVHALDAHCEQPSRIVLKKTDEWRNLFEVLLRIASGSFQNILPTFASALAVWKKCTHPTTDGLAEMLLTLAATAYKLREKPIDANIKTTQHLERCALLKQFCELEPDSLLKLTLIGKIRNEDDTTPAQEGYWFERLQGPDLEVFVDVVRSQYFDDTMREAIVSICLGTAALPQSLVLAACCRTSLELSQLYTMLDKIDASQTMNIQREALTCLLEADWHDIDFRHSSETYEQSSKLQTRICTVASSCGLDTSSISSHCSRKINAMIAENLALYRRRFLKVSSSTALLKKAIGNSGKENTTAQSSAQIKQHTQPE